LIYINSKIKLQKFRISFK